MGSLFLDKISRFRALPQRVGAQSASCGGIYFLDQTSTPDRRWMVDPLLKGTPLLILMDIENLAFVDGQENTPVIRNNYFIKIHHRNEESGYKGLGRPRSEKFGCGFGYW